MGKYESAISEKCGNISSMRHAVYSYALRALQTAADATLEVLKPLNGASEKNKLLVEEIEKLIVSLYLAKDSTYEQKLVHVVDPLIDILRSTEDKVKMKLREIDAIVASTRSQVVQKLVVISEVSGVSVEGDRETERDVYANHAADAAREAEMEQWRAVPSKLAAVVQTPGFQTDRSSALEQQAKESTGSGSEENLWPIIVLPERNQHFYCDRDYLPHLCESVWGGEEEIVVHPRGPDRRVPRCVAVLGEEAGLGKSQLVREFAHRICSLETDANVPAYQFIGWVCAADEGSLLTSYRRLAIAIRAADPQFCRLSSVAIEALKKKALIDAVNGWLADLPVPWLLIVDDVDTEEMLFTCSFPTCRMVTAAGAGVIFTSRNVDMPRRWSSLLQDRLHPGVWEEERGHDIVGLRVITVSPFTEEDSWKLCHEILGQDMDYGIEEEEERKRGTSEGAEERYDPKQLKLQIQKLTDTLHGAPAALHQAYRACLEVYRHRRMLRRQGGRGALPQTIPVSYASRVREYIHWITEFDRAAEREFPTQPVTAGAYKAFLAAQAVACEKAGGRPLAINRSLELLAFLSPSCIDVMMLSSWLRPPNTPIVASIQKKWRLPVVGGTDASRTRLPFQDAEFEIVVESVFPVNTEFGQRFTWRVHRTYERIRDAHDAMKTSYSNDMTSRRFPTVSLPYGASDEVLEDAVSHRRAELAAFLSSLVQSECWGRICRSPPMAELLGFTGFAATSHMETDSHIYQSRVLLGSGDACNATTPLPTKDSESFEKRLLPASADPFLKLIDPLITLGLLDVYMSTCDVSIRPPSDKQTKSGEDADGKISHKNKLDEMANKRVLCAMSRQVQVLVRLWLKANGRLEEVVNDVTKFIYLAFKAAHTRYKKECHSRDTPSNARLACEELLPHALCVLSTAASSFVPECFELSSMVYHYTANEGLYNDAIFCATRCIEIVKDRPGPSGPGGEHDGQWHSYLADMFCRVERCDEARALYEHSLSIFRRACGTCHRHTLSVLERLGRLLYEMGKYKHSTKVLEEALQICRQLYGNDGTGTSTSILNLALGSSVHNSSTAIANSLHIADRINQLVKVMMVDSPDSGVVSRCLDLKQNELAILRKAKGEYSAHVARCLNSIGELERRFGRTAKAVAYFEDSLDILSRCVGKDSLELVAPLFNLAIEQHTARKYSDAKRLYLRSLQIKELDVACGGKEDSVLASIHDSLGQFYSDQGQFEAALSHLQKAKDMYLDLFGSENYEVAMSLNNLAYAWQRMGDKDVARSFYSQALKTLRKVGSRSDEDTIARTQNALGELWMEVGNYKEARPLLMESLTLRVNLYGEKHRDTVVVMKNLALLSYSTGALEEAAHVCKNALSIQSGLDGGQSEEVAELTAQLAEIKRVMGKLEESKILYRRSIALFKHVHGHNHPTVALQMNNLASVFFGLGAYDECETLYLESRKILTLYHGNDHMSIAASINNLAELYRKLGRSGKALSLHEECREMRTRLVGKDHPEVAISLAQVSEILRQKGCLEEAIVTSKQALEIRINTYGMEHVDVVSSLRAIAKLMQSKGDLKEAQRLLRDALAVRHKLDATAAVSGVGGDTLSDGPESLETASVIDELCGVLDDADLDEKDSLCERCLRIRRMHLGEEHSDIANSLTALADIRSKKRQYQEAIEFHRIARAIRAKCYGEGSPATVASIDRIADCLRSLGRFEEARSLYEQCVISLRAFHDESHPDVAVALTKLAAILQLLEEYDAALNVNEKALRINNRVLGEGSVAAASSHKRIADIHRARKNASDAKLAYMKALNTYRSVLGPETIEAVQAMEGLVWALDTLGCDEEAAALSSECIELHKKVFGEEHIELARELIAVAKMLRSRGKYVEASDHFNRAMKIGIAVHGEDHENTIESLQGLAWILDARGLSNEARPLHEKARDIRNRIGGSERSDELSTPAKDDPKRNAAALLSNLSLLLSEKTE